MAQLKPVPLFEIFGFIKYSEGSAGGAQIIYQIKSLLRISSIIIILGALCRSGFCRAEEASASSSGPWALRECEADKIKFCSSGSAAQDAMTCLSSHTSELSQLCQQELNRMIEFRRAAINRGGGALGAFGGLNVLAPLAPLISLDSRLSPGNASQVVTENKILLTSPLAGNPQHLLSGSFSAGGLHFSNPVTLTSGLAVPTELYRAEIGILDYKKIQGNRSVSLRGSLGYAGDQPFQNPREATYSFNANYSFPASENSKNFFAMSVFLSNISPLGSYIPLPGFSYIYRGDEFVGVFGFPVVSMQWTPVYPWTFSMSFFGPTLQIEAARGNLDQGQIFISYVANRQSYILNQFSDPNQRLTYQEMKLAVGARKSFNGNYLAELQFGRCFNRQIYAGTSSFDDSAGLYLMPEDNYFSVSLKARF